MAKLRRAARVGGWHARPHASRRKLADSTTDRWRPFPGQLPLGLPLNDLCNRIYQSPVPDDQATRYGLQQHRFLAGWPLPAYRFHELPNQHRHRATVQIRYRPLRFRLLVDAQHDGVRRALQRVSEFIKILCLAAGARPALAGHTHPDEGEVAEWSKAPVC